MDHVALVGLPGAGKSTVGALAAAQLGRCFVDLDREIERRAGASVAELFARDGERAFRAYELEVTRVLAAGPPLVLAPGGGWMMVPGARALLGGEGRIIYLRVTPETALRRMGCGVANRPLLAGPHPLAVLRGLLAEREPVYLTADCVLDTEGVGVQQLARAVAELARGGHAD